MRMAKSVSRVLIASAMLSPAWGLPPQNAAQPHTTSTVTLQNVDQRLGPFTIAGQSFTIVLHNKRIVGAPSGDFGQTLVSWKSTTNPAPFYIRRRSLTNSKAQNSSKS